MKKSLLFIPLAALALASCNNTEDLIFENSAAERLEMGKADAIKTLTADGGLWAMEYFANTDEQGYVMLIRFNKNGSVEMSANHKFIPDERALMFTQATSLWEIVSDNGTVLSFSTYNPLLHVFSDPENITGPYAPTNPDRDDEDINETGYGHSGDYEFQIMKSDDPQTVRMLGKKRGYNIYLRRLAADTDEEAYLTSITALEGSIFTSKFPTLHLADKTTGEVFVAHATNGIMNVYALDGDSITQARKKCYITTTEGIRFISPFEVLRADGSEYEISEFRFTEDGGLESDDVEFSVPFSPLTQMVMSKGHSWTIDMTSGSASFNQLLHDFVSTHDSKYPRSKFRNLLLTYDRQTSKFALQIVEAGSSANPVFYRESVLDEAGLKLGVSTTDVNTNAKTRYANLEKLQELIEVLNSNTFNVTSTSNLLNPQTITLTSASDPEVWFNLNLQ